MLHILWSAGPTPGYVKRLNILDSLRFLLPIDCSLPGWRLPPPLILATSISMSSRHRIAEPLCRWLATIYMREYVYDKCHIWSIVHKSFSILHTGTCCTEEWDAEVDVRLCNGHGGRFYIYRFDNPPGCPTGFCVEENENNHYQGNVIKCDINQENCEVITIMLDGNSRNINLTDLSCKFTPQGITEGDDEREALDAALLPRIETTVKCKVPVVQPGSFKASVSISKDGKILFEDVHVILYDSTCQTCSEMSCTLKDGMCLTADGTCCHGDTCSSCPTKPPPGDNISDKSLIIGLSVALVGAVIVIGAIIFLYRHRIQKSRRQLTRGPPTIAEVNGNPPGNVNPQIEEYQPCLEIIPDDHPGATNMGFSPDQIPPPLNNLDNPNYDNQALNNQQLYVNSNHRQRPADNVTENEYDNPVMSSSNIDFSNCDTNNEQQNYYNVEPPEIPSTNHRNIDATNSQGPYYYAQPPEIPGIMPS